MNSKNTKLIRITWLSALLVMGVTSHALAGLSDAEKAEWTAKLKKDYPVSTCVVSGEKLQKSVMGDPVDYLHEEEGKAPRLVRFCCKGCIKSFKKDTAKYLKMIDEAARKAAASSAPAVGHEVHGH